MVIWRGWGFLTLFFILGIFGLTSGVLEPIYRAQTGFEFVYNAEKLILGGAAMMIVALVLAAFVWFVLPWMEPAPATASGQPGIVEPEAAAAAATAADTATKTPRPKPWKTRASFFFIPMWVLPIVFLVVGFLLMVLNVQDALAGIALREGA